MYRDNDPRKWEYREHTRAKHRLLSRYIKAWLSILGPRLVIVDAFAGPGRYVGGEKGSPLILRDLAQLVIDDGRVGGVELFYIEADSANCAALKKELEGTPPPPGVVERGPACAEFEIAGPRIVQLVRQDPRPSFWFIDPFGYAGVPLQLIADILRLPKAEVFVTFMARDVNRFLTDRNHVPAIGKLLGLDGNALQSALQDIMGSRQRVASLRDLYERRLRQEGGAEYVWPFRVASGGAQETVYYLVHASNHIKAFREMKDATYEESGGTFCFLGKDDFGSQAQLSFLDDLPTLKKLLAERYAGATIEYEQILNECYPDPGFHMFIQKDFHQALNEMVAEGTVTKIPVTSKTPRGLRGRDQLRFPTDRQLGMF